MRIAWRGLAVLAGLWAATLLPGIDLDPDSSWQRIGALLGGVAAFGLVWTFLELVGWLGRSAKRQFDQRVQITSTGSLAFPALTDVTVPLAPGSETLVAQSDSELTGPGVTALGSLLFKLVKFVIGLVVVVLHFWCSAWLVNQLGLRYEISGFWSTLGGAAIFNAVYVPLVMLKITRSTNHRSRPEADRASR